MLSLQSLNRQTLTISHEHILPSGLFTNIFALAAATSANDECNCIDNNKVLVKAHRHNNDYYLITISININIYVNVLSLSLSLLSLSHSPNHFNMDN